MDGSGWIAVGVVRGAFGVQGAIKIEPYNNSESTVLNQIRRWRLDVPQVGRSNRLQRKAEGEIQGGAVNIQDVPDESFPHRPGARQLPARQLPFVLPAEVAVQSARKQGDFMVATIAPALTREQALALRGVEILVDRREFPAPDPDEYYWTDLIGCQVFDPSGRILGTVQTLEDNGAQSVLRLENRMLIPFVAACVLEVSPDQKRIVADWSADWS